MLGYFWYELIETKYRAQECLSKFQFNAEVDSSLDFIFPIFCYFKTLLIFQ